MREAAPPDFLSLAPWGRVGAWRVLAGTELGLGLALLAGDPPGLSSWTSAVLLSAFLAYTTVVVARGAQGHCACFGTVLPERWGLPPVARNAMLCVIAWTGAVLSSPRASGTVIILGLAAMAALLLLPQPPVPVTLLPAAAPLGLP